MFSVSSVTDRSASPEAPAVGMPVLSILRFEGLIVAVISAAIYMKLGASWWLFSFAWLAPDLSMLAYLAGPGFGSRIYNAFHSYVPAGTMAAMALLLHAPVLLPFALIWINHIGVDRLLGYGLKYPAGFEWTHLGRTKREPSGSIQPSEPRAAFQVSAPAPPVTAQS